MKTEKTMTEEQPADARKPRRILRILAGVLVPVIWLIACTAYSHRCYELRSISVSERPFQAAGLLLSVPFLMCASGFFGKMRLRLRIDWIIMYILILGFGFCVTHFVCLALKPWLGEFDSEILNPIALFRY